MFRNSCTGKIGRWDPEEEEELTRKFRMLLRKVSIAALVAVARSSEPPPVVDVRVCTIFALKHEPWELLWHSVHHWGDVGVPLEWMNVILASDGAKKEVVVEVTQDLIEMGVPQSNIAEVKEKYSADRQYDWYKNCSMASVERRPATGALWWAWIDSDELPVIPVPKSSLHFDPSLDFIFYWDRLCRAFSKL